MKILIAITLLLLTTGCSTLGAMGNSLSQTARPEQTQFNCLTTYTEFNSYTTCH